MDDSLSPRPDGGAALSAATSISAPARPAHLFSRRGFMGSAGWTAVLASLAGLTAAALRMLRPWQREQDGASLVSIGHLADYPPRSVSQRFLTSHGFFVVHDGANLCAVLARCTHLGCMPRWSEADDRFLCPCHGSTYAGLRRTGTRGTGGGGSTGSASDAGATWDAGVVGVPLSGPARRALPRLALAIDGSGEISVDLSRPLWRERGDWQRRAASWRAGG